MTVPYIDRQRPQMTSAPKVVMTLLRSPNECPLQKPWQKTTKSSFPFLHSKHKPSINSQTVKHTEEANQKQNKPKSKIKPKPNQKKQYNQKTSNKHLSNLSPHSSLFPLLSCGIELLLVLPELCAQPARHHGALRQGLLLLTERGRLVENPVWAGGSKDLRTKTPGKNPGKPTIFLVT